jgi:hypothetical protein
MLPQTARTEIQVDFHHFVNLFPVLFPPPSFYSNIVFMYSAAARARKPAEADETSFVNFLPIGSFNIYYYQETVAFPISMSKTLKQDTGTVAGAELNPILAAHRPFSSHLH